MTKKVLLLLSLFFLLQSNFVSAQDTDTYKEAYIDQDDVVFPSSGTKTRIYSYGYNDRNHSVEENLKNIGLVYGLTWVFYPIVQPKVFEVRNGFSAYRHNFGKVVFDKDEPVWNFFVHPISGSQLYLLYRSIGYSRMGAMGMATVSSTLFEFTVETLTEPASVQDLYQTPILGTVLGLGIENFSMYMLNTGTTVGKVVGHIINPATLLPFYEGRTLIIPKFEPEDKGAMFRLELKY